MSPIRKPPPFSGRTLIHAIIAIIVGLALLWAASATLTARHNRQTSGGGVGGIVALGDASRLVSEFERGGGAPLYFPDVSGNARRSVYLTHDGGPADTGWTAFRAQVQGEEDDDCQWEWNAATTRFDASCDPDRHASADGTGLEQYPVTVHEGRLRVDLRTDPVGTTTVAEDPAG